VAAARSGLYPSTLATFLTGRPVGAAGGAVTAAGRARLVCPPDLVSDQERATPAGTQPTPWSVSRGCHSGGCGTFLIAHEVRGPHQPRPARPRSPHRRPLPGRPVRKVAKVDGYTPDRAAATVRPTARRTTPARPAAPGVRESGTAAPAPTVPDREPTPTRRVPKGCRTILRGYPHLSDDLGAPPRGRGGRPAVTRSRSGHRRCAILIVAGLAASVLATRKRSLRMPTTDQTTPISAR